MLQKSDLVRCKHRCGKDLKKKCLERRQRKWNGRQPASAARFAQNEFHQLPECVDAWTTELVHIAARIDTLEGAHDCCRNVANIDRLKAGEAAADQRQRGKRPGERGKPVEELILGSEHD